MWPSTTQLLGYGALAIAIVAIGARWVGAGGEQAGAATTVIGGKLADHRPAAGIVIHVAGAVRRPGVYELRTGSRVADAVERAGGATRSGEVNAVNLAAPLTDGQQVVIPGAGSASSVAGGSEGPISLGSATAEDLDQIDGIGPVTAAAIIEYRDSGRPISRIEDLDAVAGIGPATIEALRSRLQP
jgi:competence protein ComEA